MSVINRMLADLERRGTRSAPAVDVQSTDASHAAAAIVPVPRRAGAWRVRLMVLLGTGLASAAALGNWPQWFGGEQRLPQPVAMVLAPAVAPASTLVSQGTASASPRESTARVTGLSYALSIPAPRAPVGLRDKPPRKAAKVPQPPQAAASQAAATAPDAVSSIDKQMIALSGAQRAAQAYRQATDLATSGVSSQAIDKALEALRYEPRHIGARQLAAVLLFETSRYDDARALLADALALGLHDPQLTYLAARLMVESGDRDGALRVLTDATVLNADAHGLRAGVLAQQGRYADALPSYEAALRLNPENASWWVGLGAALDVLGQSAAARLAFQRARALGSLQGDLLAYVEQKLAEKTP